MESPLLDVVIVTGTIVTLVALVSWARGNGRSVCLGAALVVCSIFPDPVFERVLRVVNESREAVAEEENAGGSGHPDYLPPPH
ncbi:MAG: hypothetical protein AAGE01_00530 [Pseudomonadota bacterium]